jgi:hypothetical protein
VALRAVDGGHRVKLRVVRARQGALWVRSGFRIFFRRPVAFAMLFAAFLFCALLTMLLPLAGPLLLLAALPQATLGFMIATHVALKGGFPLPGVFVQTLRASSPRRLAMLKLGLVYAAATFAILWLADVVDAGKFDALQEAMASAKTPAEDIRERLLDPQLQLGLLVRLGLASLLSLPFWHAPALVHWGSQTWGKALFFSTVACWRNKGAFAVYGLTWTAVIVLFGVLANTVFTLLGQPSLVAMAAMPAGLMFSTVFYVSLFFTFADCFEQKPGKLTPELAGPPPGPVQD